MYKKQRQWEKHFDFIILDLFMIIITYLIAGFYRFGLMFLYGDEIKYVALLALIYFAVAMLFSNYKNILRRTLLQELRSVIIQFVATYGIFIALLYLSRDAYEFSRLLFSVSAVAGFIAVVIIRSIWKNFLFNVLIREDRLPRLYVIGTRDNCSKYISQVNDRKSKTVNIRGAIISDTTEEYGAGDELAGTPIVCQFEDYQAFCLRHVIDEVFICTGQADLDMDIASYFVEMGVVVHVGLTINGDFDNLPDSWVEKKDGFAMYTSCYRVVNGWELVAKRLFDIIGGLVGLIITIILYIILAPQIKHADPGPAIFSQKRVGKNGRVFKFYKFRSMYQDAEARKAELMQQNEMGDNHMFKMEDDPRILPGIGSMIRNTSLDEFPQFINVLKGDMSLVGTRPPTVDEFKEYEPHHKARLAFKPGITGVWQTSGRSDVKDFEDIVRMDNEYIRNWSIWLDLRLLLKTVKVVLKKEGSR